MVEFSWKSWKRRRRRKKAPRASMERGLRWLTEKGFEVGTVLDVGASYGIWSQRCMAFYPHADYILFEPNPVHHQRLDLFAMHSAGKVVPVKKAVGDREGTSDFQFDPEDPFSGALGTGNSPETIVVEVTTLDAALAGIGVEGPFLLKLDTHGYEKGILDGAKHTLVNSNVLVIEAYNYRITEEALLFWELCAYLGERGFRPVDLVDVGHRKYDGSLWQMDLILVRSDWEGFKCNSYREP